MSARASLLFCLSLSLTACDGGSETKVDETQVKAKAEADEIYETRCVTCHGAQGKGDGPGAATLEPKPRSFTDPGWQGKATDEQITKIILEGGMGVQMSPAMPANPDLQTKAEVVKALVLKIRKMQQ